jgi:putative chitinase
MPALSKDQLLKIMPRLKPATADAYLPHLLTALDEAGITTPLRVAAFLAQIAHESGDFRFMSELWGPTDQQKKYERPIVDGKPAPLATAKPFPLWQKLGNTESGDGFRFRGAGPIQITGRYNFEKFGKLLGLDLVKDPDQARKPGVGFRLAGGYWTDRKLNELADAQDFDGITKAINGGFNGKPERDAYYHRALTVLGA